MKRPLSGWVLVVALAVLALGGLAGAYGFLSDPTGEGMGMSLVLDRLTVADYRLPGVFLFVAMFLCPTVTIYGLLARPTWRAVEPLVGWSRSHWARVVPLGSGAGLALWLALQALLIGFAAPMQWFTAVLDLAILSAALAPPTGAFHRRGVLR